MDLKNNLKNFKVIFNNKIVEIVPIYVNAKIGEIKDHLKRIVTSKGLNPEYYDYQIYSDRTNRLASDDQYNDYTLAGNWNSITNGYLVIRLLPTVNFESLPKDVIVAIALNMNISDISGLCQTSKFFNDAICNNNSFWVSKLRQDYDKNVPNPTDNPGEYYKDLTELQGEVLEGYNLYRLGTSPNIFRGYLATRKLKDNDVLVFENVPIPVDVMRKRKKVVTGIMDLKYVDNVWNSVEIETPLVTNKKRLTDFWKKYFNNTKGDLGTKYVFRDFNVFN